jgi:hypothetical protein
MLLGRNVEKRRRRIRKALARNRLRVPTAIYRYTTRGMISLHTRRGVNDKWKATKATVELLKDAK